MNMLDGVRVALDAFSGVLLTLGDPIDGFRTMTEAGADDGVVYTWVIEANFSGGIAQSREGGTGVYDSSGGTLVRDTLWSTETANAQITPVGAAHVIITLGATNYGPYVKNTQFDLADSTGGIQAAIEYAYANGIGEVIYGPDDVEITAAISMRPGVDLKNPYKAEIKQADGADLGMMIEYFTNVAHGAKLDAILDGNADNNTGMSYLVFTSYTGIPVDDADVSGCTLKNSGGGGGIHYVGKRPRFLTNHLEDIFSTGFAIATGTNDYQTDGKVLDNTFINVHLHHVLWQKSDGLEVADNTCVGHCTAGLTVDTTSATNSVVTRTAGPTFANCRPGMILAANGTIESQILSVTDNDHVVLADNVGAHTGYKAAYGTGDMISGDSSSDACVHHNKLSGGVTYGIVTANLEGGATGKSNAIWQNILRNMGGPAIGIYNYNANPSLKHTLVASNQIRNVGLRSDAGGSDPSLHAGVHVFGQATKTTITDNNIRDDGPGLTVNGIYAEGVLEGQIDLGPNFISGFVENAINATTPLNTAYAQFCECYLAIDGSDLRLYPNKGNALFINGNNEQISIAGLALAPPSGTNSLFIYALMTAGVMSIEASATAPAAHPVFNYQCKTGDRSRTLVGQARTVTGAWVNSATKQFVRSWFFKDTLFGKNVFTTTRTTTSTTTVEISSEIRIEFLAWYGEEIHARWDGHLANSASGFTYAAVAFDTAVGRYVGVAGTTSFPTSAEETDKQLAGYHYVTVNGFVASGTGSYGNGSESAGQLQLTSTR